MMFAKWLATNPIGGFAKVATGAMLVWIVDNLSTFQIPEIVQVGLIAGLPIIINWLNPADLRYGKSSYETRSE